MHKFKGTWNKAIAISVYCIDKIIKNFNFSNQVWVRLKYWFIISCHLLKSRKIN